MQTTSVDLTVRKDLIRLGVLVACLILIIIGLKIADDRQGLIQQIGSRVFQQIIN